MVVYLLEMSSDKLLTYNEHHLFINSKDAKDTCDVWMENIRSELECFFNAKTEVIYNGFYIHTISVKFEDSDEEFLLNFNITSHEVNTSSITPEPTIKVLS